MDDEWCPSINGTCQAYMPQFYDLERKAWRDVPTAESGRFGVPFPIGQGLLFQHMGLFGYEQAWALAWSYAAWSASQGVAPKVRVQKYEFVYDIKARRTENAEEPR